MSGVMPVEDLAWFETPDDAVYPTARAVEILDVVVTDAATAELIDGATTDHVVGPNAMRWTPRPEGRP